MTDHDKARELAIVEALGALAYGQLRAFAVTARAVVRAPSVRDADAVIRFAEQELSAYRRLRRRLAELTDLGDGAMERQRQSFDLFFDGDHLETWPELCTLFAIGLPLAADFTAALAPHLDDDTAAVLLDALGSRQEFEEWATEQLGHHLDEDPAHWEQVRHVVADLAGRMLTAFQRVMADTDALRVLLTADVDAEAAEAAHDAAVRHLAVDVLGAHRARMVALGLEPDDA